MNSTNKKKSKILKIQTFVGKQRPSVPSALVYLSKNHNKNTFKCHHKLKKKTLLLLLNWIRMNYICMKMQQKKSMTNKKTQQNNIAKILRWVNINYLNNWLIRYKNFRMKKISIILKISTLILKKDSIRRE